MGTPVGNYWIPVATAKSRAQEGDEIARAWVADPKVYPGIPMSEGSLVAIGGCFVKNTPFCLKYHKK